MGLKHPGQESLGRSLILLPTLLVPTQSRRATALRSHCREPLAVGGRVHLARQLPAGPLPPFWGEYSTLSLSRSKCIYTKYLSCFSRSVSINGAEHSLLFPFISSNAHKEVDVNPTLNAHKNTFHKNYYLVVVSQRGHMSELNRVVLVMNSRKCLRCFRHTQDPVHAYTQQRRPLLWLHNFRNISLRGWVAKDC